MKPLTAAVAVLALAACSPQGQKSPAPSAPAAAPPAVPPVPKDLPAGDYTLDKAHSSLNFRVSHMGFSHYTARFTRFDAKLHFDPVHPETSTITVDIDPASIQTNYPEPQKLDFDAQLRRQFLDTEHFPKMTFQSTRVEVTGANTARVTGNLTLHGVTKPVVLDVTFNGGYASMPMDPSGSRIGFSAKGTLKRSDFGISFGVPSPGTTMGVGDEVEVIIETEFSRPKTPPA